MRAGNVAIKPLGLIEVNSGNIKSFDFNIRSDKTRSTGKLTFLYNNLKVALVKQDDEKTYSKRPLISLLANFLVIKNNNPDDSDSQPRSELITYVRPIGTPFFETIWLTLLSGIKSTAGLGNKQSTQTKAPSTQKENKKPAGAIKKLGKTISKIFG